MKTNKYLNPNTALTTIFVLAAYWLLAVRGGYMLRWMDEMSLFEPTRIFFRQFLYYPGGLLRWAGAWLTQLLYYPWLGATSLIALWLLLAWLITKALRLSESAAPLALIVPIAMLVSVVQMDEAWLSLNSAGYVFSNTLGYIFSVGIVLVFRQSLKKPLLSVLIAAVVALCYPIAGFYALLGAALCGILAIITAFSEKVYLNITPAAIATVSIAVIPPLYYTYLHSNTVDNDYLYLKGLPELMMEAFDLYLWMPFIVATGILLLMAILSGLGWLGDSKYLKWISIVAVVCGLGWNEKASQKSEQLRATVLMLQKLDRYDWAGISGVMSRIKEPPNLTMRMLYNLAILNQGGDPQSLNGQKPQRGDGRHSEKFTITAFANVPIYCNMGRLSESYRWAMEHTVQYGKRVFFLKYMMKCALLRGDILLARRYNDILKSTLFHRQWAQDMERYINDPKLMDSDPDMQRILLFGEGERKRGNTKTTADIH